MSGKAKGKTPEEEAEALRTLLREAHEAMRDLRTLLREVRDLRTEVAGTAAIVFTEQMEQQVREGLATYNQSIQQAIKDAEAAVDRRFDTIASILLGEEKRQVRAGQPTIADLAREKVDRDGPVTEVPEVLKP